MKGNSRNLTILIFISILATGCASNGTTETSSTSGTVTANSFEASPNPATAGRTMSVNLELENTGDAKAEEVAARIFGPTWATEDSQEGAWRDSSESAISNKEDRTLSFGDLRAAGDDTPSVPKRKSLTLTAPSTSRDYSTTFKSKIFYQYETTANTNFKIVSGERFQNENLERTESTLDTSTAPIDLTIRGTTPKVFYRDDGENPTDQVQSEICIKAENKGPGTAFLNDNEVKTGDDRVYNVDESKKDKLVLQIQDIANINFKSNDGSENTVIIELVNGEEGFQCFTMEAKSLASQDSQTVRTKIIAQYGYMKEDETTVTLEGRNTGNNEINIPEQDNNEDNDGENNENDEGSEDNSGEDEYEYTGSQLSLTREILKQNEYPDTETSEITENQVCEYIKNNENENLKFDDVCEEK